MPIDGKMLFASFTSPHTAHCAGHGVYSIGDDMTGSSSADHNVDELAVAPHAPCHPTRRFGHNLLIVMAFVVSADCQRAAKLPVRRDDRPPRHKLGMGLIGPPARDNPGSAIVALPPAANASSTPDASGFTRLPMADSSS